MTEIIMISAFITCLWAFYCNHVTYKKMVNSIHTGLHWKYHELNKLYDPIFYHFMLFKLTKNPLDRIEMEEKDREEAEKIMKGYFW